MGVVDLPAEGLRQLDRATRLLDAQASAPSGSKKPVHKALEQLFGEARSRTQAQGVFATTGFAGNASRLLQGPQAQRLDREVTDFTLGSAGPEVGGLAADVAPEDSLNLSAEEFFGLRHERVMLSVIEEAHRDALNSCEKYSLDKLNDDWQAAKAQILSALAPQRPGAAPVPVADQLPSAVAFGAGALAAPPQDAAIIDTLRQTLSPSLVLRVGQLSADSCPAYRGELAECWGITSHMLEPTPRGATCGALRYLQGRYAEEVKALVYRSADARLGGVPDAWSLVSAFGRAKFETAAFPATPQHVWYAAYIAARAGFAHLLLDLPDRATPYSEQCPMLRTVCSLMARRLQAVVPTGQPSDFAASAALGVDRNDLLRADLSEEGGPFHDVLVALLLGRNFAFGRLPEGTVEDWLWFRLHAVHIAAGDNDQAPEFEQHLDALKQQALSLPPSHYDPAPGSVGIAPAGFRGVVDPLAGGNPGGGPGLGMAVGITQTLNFVKVLLLTLQPSRAIQQLRSQDRSLRGPAVHLALVLRRCGALDAASSSTAAEGEAPLDVAGLVCDYAAQFACSDQLQYFRLLDPPDRVEALQRLLLRGGVGTNDELLGQIDSNGRHRPGLLEQTLQAEGLAERAEFVDLCARAGRSALEGGQYREALRLLHLGRCHSEVLQVLCRCLRLPIWHDAAIASSEEAGALGQDVQWFFSIYERNLDRYAISSQAWALARKHFAARMFHSLCERGQPEAALDVFDREQLLPLDLERCPESPEVDAEAVVEYPRIVANYVRILRHAASQGAPVQPRIRQLQAFLAVHAHRLSLDEETVGALAALTLC
mmetsp:Transcript_75057/g.195257  ORF Transcript_75057/g.195257 Transcript_75057/m.195257 type:complete len:825 (+) Transcript_75057:100-2574(+)